MHLHEKKEKAFKVLVKAADENKRNTEFTQENLPTLDKDDTSSWTKFIEVFTNRTLRKRILVMFFNWFSVSFIIYGLNLNWKTLTGSLFLNFLIVS